MYLYRRLRSHTVFDTRLKIVAAAHAGWRGTVAGIAAKTLRVMADAYGTRGQDVAACIGPSISPDAFEVGDEVYEAFRSAGFRMDRIAFRRGNGTSTCGKPTGCSCLTPESCRKCRTLRHLHLQCSGRLLFSPPSGNPFRPYPFGHHAAEIIGRRYAGWKHRAAYIAFAPAFFAVFLILFHSSDSE